MLKRLLALCLVLCTVSGCGTNEITVNSTVNFENLDSKGMGWGFVRKKGNEPDIPVSQKNILKTYNGFYLGNTQEKNLYLTFDEGYENGFTAMILDILKKTETPAAFFVTGPYLEGQQDLIKRMINEGHTVGNHTVNHLNLPKQSVDVIKKELIELNDKCEELYGYKMEYMRPPEGEFSEKSLAVTNELGYKTVMWSFAYKDWDVNNQKGADYAYQSVMPYLHNGAIILLHAVSHDNATALERIITDAKAQGYTFKSITEL